MDTPETDAPTADRQHYGFFLVDKFTLIGFASAVEPLRMANLAARDQPFRWSTITKDGKAVKSSSGIPVQPDYAMAEAPTLDAVFVCGSNPIPEAIDPESLDWLRLLVRQGTDVGGICTGSYWLAKAGLLHGYRCTLHWEDTDRLLTDFDEPIVSKRIFEIDRGRYTCSGGIAPVDMMISLVSLHAGKELASKVAELMVCDRVRSAEDPQRIPLRQSVGTSQPKLTAAVSIMENNLDEPLRTEELAHYVNISPRQLERLFQEHLKCTPGGYYLELRLLRARQLLLATEDPIIDIAAASGFASVAHFTRRYRERFGIPPGKERRTVSA